ncbi:endopeptidase La [Metamycoplasma hyosynoviae]|uniref:endopeptidase La n=1 Tax=Metamycoplasma hyosynoviae TaxID=29559 RepID=UPI0023606ADD|nr:endopeptidase La [Metamycoplasma hyosynoviae]MDD1378509.1 endopeptidase La [Metamycoplasma hyosynoviae]
MKLPYIAIKNQIIVPFSEDHIRVGKKRSIDSLKLATSKKYENNLVIVFLKKDVAGEELKKDDIYEYGVLTKILDTKQKSSIYQVTLQCGADIIRVKKLITDDKDQQLIDFEFIPPEEKIYNREVVYKLRNSLLELIRAAKAMDVRFGIDKSSSSTSITKNEFASAEDALLFDSLDYDTEWINIHKVITALKSDLSLEELTKLSQTISITEAYDILISKISNIIKMLKVDSEISTTMRNELDEQQKDFLLREKMRQIKKMLKEDDGTKELEKILSDDEKMKQFPQYVIDCIQAEQSRIANMMPSSPEVNIAKNYIDLLLALPWRKVSKELLDINNVRKILNKHHYGLEKPKERILEFISVLTHTKSKEKDQEYIPIKDDPNNFVDTKLFINKLGTVTNEPINNIPILTLIGPPGVGKTTLAKSIAEALDRKFIKVSLGGVKDEAEIRGHRRTYVGAMPGKIINAIKKAGVSNPVILLDEIDKMSADFRGDPVSAMLEVLDPEQNANFQDHYLDLEYDLSKVLFIATANYYDSIPAALIDRVELLELSTYTVIEKIEIAKSHLLPKVLDQNKIEPKQYQISDEVIEFIIRNYTRESGVRELKRILDTIARKIVIRILDKKIKNEFIITQDIIKEFLGPVKFAEDENENKAQVGVVNGLAYTNFGGSTLAIEVTTFKGKEGLKLTGSLKDVMKESAQIALAYVRHNADKFGIKFDFDEYSIHIHVPEGAVPKDGPSAGVTFTTSIISALLNKPVPANIAMTGEITLRGKVLAIGGLKEKSLAASKFDIKKIFIPFENQRHLVDVPAEVKKVVEFIPVKYYDEIFESIFK